MCLLGETKRKNIYIQFSPLSSLSISLSLPHSLSSGFSFIFGFPKSYLERKISRSHWWKKELIDPAYRVRGIYSWATCFKSFRLLLLSYFLYIKIYSLWKVHQTMLKMANYRVIVRIHSRKRMYFYLKKWKVVVLIYL